jgi:hypothetical protein
MRTERKDLLVIGTTVAIVIAVCSALLAIVPSSVAWQSGAALAVALTAFYLVPRFFTEFRTEEISKEALASALREAERLGVTLGDIEHPTAPDSKAALEKALSSQGTDSAHAASTPTVETQGSNK